MANINEKLDAESKKMAKQERGEYPEAWKPKEIGERLQGELIELENGRDAKTESLLFWTVKEKNGKEWSVLECATIESARKKLKIEVGDSVGLEFRGTKTSKRGNEYKLFVVVKG